MEEDKNTSIRRLRQLFFGARTETTEAVVGQKTRKPDAAFLHQAGAPLENNLCERALKKAILNRKNALFSKTRNGARVGDLFISLIYTCQLSQANPFDSLTRLQRHADRLAVSPQLWIPWNDRDALA